MKKRYSLMNFILVVIMVFVISLQQALAQQINFPELDITLDGTEPDYLISTLVYSGDEIGVVDSISGYRVYYKMKPLEGGETFYYFYQIEKADNVTEIEDLNWVEYPNIKEFKIILDESNNMLATEQYLAQIPHDSIDTYNVYVSLMDIVMYDNYRRTIIRELLDKGQQNYQEPEPEEVIVFPDWEPIIYGISFISAGTHFEHIGSNAEGEEVIYYKQDGTYIKQTIRNGIIIMPIEGTTRFMGLIRLDEGGLLTHATMSEYYLMKAVILPLFMKLNMLVRREQVLELLEE